MFDADRPIQKNEQDRLGRSGFAKYLARSILDHKNPESLVIGLYGGFGTGKTSLINLIAEELQLAGNNMLDEEKPVVLNFSPWSYSGQDSLIYHFFRRLSSAIRHAPQFKNSEKIVFLLELYVSFFTNRPTPQLLQPKKQLLKQFLSETSNQYGWESGRDLTHVKAELNELLRQQKHKIIIFIDNIARLHDEEIAQIFQITKSMGDYLNTVYVLAIDKQRVMHAIANVYHLNGTDYLEKIVQLPFEIPAFSKQDVESILLDRLTPVVNAVPEDMWDNKYWNDIYYLALKYFFNDCRDITHYVNTLSFSFPRVKELVNPVDFFAITVLHVFSPEIFLKIKENKDLFTDLVSHVFEDDKNKMLEDSLRCDNILNFSTTVPEDVLKKLLMILFPKLRALYEKNVPFYHSEELSRRNRRICSADFFDAYFQFAIPSRDISAAEMNAILSLASHKKAFAETILCLNKDERALYFLEKLDSISSHKIPENNRKNIIEALLDCADLFPEGMESPLRVNTPMRIHRILHQLFRQISNPEERFITFREAIKNSALSVYSLVHEINAQYDEKLAAEDTLIPAEQHDFTLNQLETLQKLVCQKISYWATMDRLAEHPKLMELLRAFKAWGDNNECENFVGHLVQEDKGLIVFLCAALKEPIIQTMTKLTKNTLWSEYLSIIEEFISVNIIAPHAKMIFEDPDFEKLREEEQLAILIFLDLIHADTTKTIPQTTPE
ncbi:MAG: hypothetical protein ACD_60C00160G0016 [uncultured bacterium]|nr:MAG: hypothetical protein ACD_60C00160G0016 [uncultured bacterium]